MYNLLYFLNIQNNSYNTLPKSINSNKLSNEILYTICNYNTHINKLYTINEIKKTAKDNLNLYLLFKYKKNIGILHDLKNIFNLINKYNYYQDSYEKNIKIQSIYKSNHLVSTLPILLDILFAGCDLPYGFSTLENFNNDNYNDIKNIIKLIPNSINSNFGLLRCRTSVKPIHAACYNYNIPIYVIKYLLENGANKNDHILVNGYETDILDDLKENISSYRYNQIKKLFDTF